MGDAPPSAKELATIAELADAHGVGASTAWLLVKQHGLEQFRMPGRRKLAFYRKADFARVKNTPVPVPRPQQRDGDDPDTRVAA